MAQQCMDCKFAKWNLTDTGRKHPNGMGRCTWSKTYHVAASVVSIAYEIGEPLTVTGGWICRKNGDERPNVGCDVFQPIKKG